MNLFVAYFIAFLIGTYSIPLFIETVKIHRYFDSSSKEGKLNALLVPTLAGISVFIAIFTLPF